MKKQLKMSQVVSLIAAAFAVVIFSAGCSMKQDPYADASDDVKNGVPPSKDVAAPVGKADDPRNYRIDSADTLTFDEGKSDTAQITGRILTPVNGHTAVLGQDYSISIDNISDFPGATFDAASGTFKWTPAPGYVIQNSTRNVTLQVSMQTTDGRRMSRDILAVVTRSEVDPTIVSVEDLLTTPTKEGAIRQFQVVVQDPHALDQDNMRPRLQITTGDVGSASAANYISMQSGFGTANPAKNPSNPSQWIFTLILDLRNKEVTTGKTTLSFGLIATSRFGEASGTTKVQASIMTGVGDTQITWAQATPIDVIAGQPNVVNFSIFDPKSDGNLTANFDTQCSTALGVTGSCSCTALPVAAGSIATQLCTIKWTPPTMPGTQPYAISVSSFNQNKYDQTVQKTQFTRYLRVVQPGVPPPPFVLPANAQVNPAPTNAALNANSAGANL